MKPRHAAGLAAVALFAFAAIAVAAPGNTTVKEFKAKQVEPGTVRYSGKIKSDKDGCEEKREFAIIHDGVKIATGKTDKDGSFSVPGPEPPDDDKVTVRVYSEDNCDRAKKSILYNEP